MALGSEGDAHRSGELWDQRRRVLQRLGNCCVRICADLWSMACFLWAAPDSVAQGGERSKRGRALAHEAASLQDSDPERLEREIRIFKGGWESKRQTVYARWARADWTKRQWWVEHFFKQITSDISNPSKMGASLKALGFSIRIRVPRYHYLGVLVR